MNGARYASNKKLKLEKIADHMIKTRNQGNKSMQNFSSKLKGGDINDLPALKQTPEYTCRLIGNFQPVTKILPLAN